MEKGEKTATNNANITEKQWVDRVSKLQHARISAGDPRWVGETTPGDSSEAPYDEHQGAYTEAQVDYIINKSCAEGTPRPNGLPQVLFKSNPSFWAKTLTPLYNHAMAT